jgi:hypothetical protein
MDIIIYDKRVLPPLIKNQNLGLYPIESVLAIIEVKSNLRKQDLLNTEKQFRYIHEEICSLKHSIYSEEYKPIFGLIGFYGTGLSELRSSERGKNWLNDNIKALFAICLMQEYCWLRLNPWKFSPCNAVTFEETKRFISVILDNIRTKSTKEPYLLIGKHKDWLSVYLRDQDHITEYLEKKRNNQS